MKYKITDRNRADAFFLPMFVTGAAVVWILIMIQGSDLLLQTDVLKESTLGLMKYQAQDSRSLFLYVLKERWTVVPILFLASTTYLTAYVVYGTLLWYGIATGALMGIAMLRYGLRGVLFILAAGMPQYLLYIPVMLLAMRLCIRQRIPDKRFWGQLFILELVVIIGCGLESYVNLYIIEKIVKFFITG